MSTDSPLERLKTEAERWIAGVTTDGSLSGVAASGVRDIVGRAYELGLSALSEIAPTQNGHESTQDGHESALSATGDTALLDFMEGYIIEGTDPRTGKVSWLADAECIRDTIETAIEDVKRKRGATDSGRDK